MSSQPDISKRGLVLLFFFSFAIWFGTLDYRKLAKPDEGRYAEISREMVVTGDWLTPRLNGIKYFEKPPLQYWATATAYTAFGFHEWTARLWTALTGFLTILLIWWQGRRIFGGKPALYAAMALASNFYFLGLGHINTLDMGLAFFTTLALVGFVSAQSDEIGNREKNRWMLTTWAAMALAMLSKGLIGIVLPGATLFLYTIFTRDWAIWRRLHLVPGLLIFLVIAAPWFIAVSIKNPEFAWFFFIHEHFMRYATPEARREGPIYYFVDLLVLGMLPWSLVLVESIWNAVRNLRTPDKQLNKPTLILLIWTTFIFVFFSLSSSKLPAYILPIFPSLALLMGKRLNQLEAKQLVVRIIPVGLLMICGIFYIPYVIDHAEDPVSQALYREYSYWLYAGAFTMLAGIAYSCWHSLRGDKLKAIVSIALAGFLFGHLAVTGYEALSPNQSTYHFAEKIRPYVSKEIPFYSIKMYDQTLPFYLRRTVTLVDYKDEFSYGLEQEPTLAINTMSEFSQQWKHDKEALAIMQPDTYRALLAEKYPMEVIAEDGKRVVVKKIEGKP
ncbi:MAG: glycosyltransferase family 39 protein [Pseudomonadota bacterium]